VVLADHDKIAGVWEHLPPNEHYLAKRAGSRYLLRGIQLPGGGAFHPKSYLFSRGNAATLVVGSGNLTRDGIDGGREAFTSFSTEHEQDLPSLRAWAAWMGRLVRAQDDPLLSERWDALRATSPWMVGSTERSLLVANDEQSVLETLLAQLPNDVAELHVTAPYFDRDAEALAELLTRADPARVTLYVGAGMSVNGGRLASVLSQTHAARVLSFEPRTFVHAKLIGAIGAGGDGVLLVGSPNLSRAALTLTSTMPHGNSELAVLRPGSADAVRAVFEGSGLELVERPLSALESFTFDEDPPSPRRPLTLRRATWQSDGRVHVEWTGTDPGVPYLQWDPEAEPVALDVAGTSLEALNTRDPAPLIAWLANGAAALSNRVVIDNPRALREALTGSDRKASSRPSELEGLELVPLVRLALWAHDKFIFDLDDTSAIRRANDAATEEAGDQDTSAFWDQYARAELEYDARVHSYRPLVAGDVRLGPVDELLRELQVLLYAAPDAPHPVLHAVTGGEPSEGADAQHDHHAGTPWTMDARQRVRAQRLLNRWCEAVGDPRHALIAPDAPVVNYQTLLAVLLLAWMHEALEARHLHALLLKLLQAFVGEDHRQGFLGRASEAQRTDALERLDPFMAEVAAGLVAAALDVRGWRTVVYDWQSVLRRAIETGVLTVGEWSAAVCSRLTGQATTENALTDLLLDRSDYIDDATWCERLASELDLRDIALDLRRGSTTVNTGVNVYGAGDTLRDGRLLTVARRALDYKGVPAIAVRSGDDVLIVEPGKRARGRVSGVRWDSSAPVGVDRLKAIEAQGGAWIDVLDEGPRERAAKAT
jgi:hypothetical protein